MDTTTTASIDLGHSVPMPIYCRCSSGSGGPTVVLDHEYRTGTCTAPAPVRFRH